MSRTYDMSRRSEKAAQTTENIIAATERLLTEKPLEKISLNAIAKESGITVQTVLRHMDSREGCIYAVAERVSSRVEKQRGGSESGNITEAIENLIEHYEQEGKLVLNLLTQEHSEESFASDFTAEGRNFHRQWVERCFGPHVAGNETEVIDALVVATDIYTWKLLRLDLGRPLDTTKKIITNMVSKILEIP
ncbi:MAG: TetR family transcriptional regulator [Balneolaceae bacterium]|nr:TetR family transcriptional regulator [Balneolaceae bacterium]